MSRRPALIRFGWDGWHARFDDAFTRENVVRIADGLGLMWGDASPGASVYVGYDTRFDSAEMALAAAETLASYGLRVTLSDSVCPTPAVGWACSQSQHVAGGVVITASDRPAEYGGFIIRGADGGPVSQVFLAALERNISQRPKVVGRSVDTADLVGPYLDDMAKWVDVLGIRAAHLSVVVDPMHGAGTSCLAELLRRLGCNVLELHAEPRADFGGIQPDPKGQWANACCETVVATGADLGVLLDGDGDRCSVVDEKGNLIPPRVIVPLIVRQLVQGHGKTGRVVSTIPCSDCIRREAELLGLEYTSVPVGFSRIYREVLEGDVLLGTEEYAGICIPEHFNERDGLLVIILALEALVQSGQSMSQVVEELESQIGSTSYSRRDVAIDPALTQAFRNILPGLNPASFAGRTPVDVGHADGLRLQFEEDSWVLIRPSRAGSTVRVYAEASTEAQCNELLEAACDFVQRGI